MWIAVLLAAALFAADQYLKHLSRHNKFPASLLRGKIQLMHLENPGLIFGLGKKNQPLTAILPCGAWLAALFSALPGFKRKSTSEKAGIMLVLAGGAGNMLDRLLRGSVTDYIRFPHLPGKKLRTLVWNVADFMLLAGSVILVFCEISKLFRKKTTL